MKNDIKIITVSVVMICIAIGTMWLFKQQSTGRTIGGALFMVGCIMLAMALFNAIKK